MIDAIPEAFTSTLNGERSRRELIWDALAKIGDEVSAPMRPDEIRALSIYGGAQGCWVDVDRTRISGAFGITVGVLHTGEFYADDLTDDGLVYHFPKTKRPAGRDLSEIEATKNCSRFDIWLFVVTQPDERWRRVRRGWVTGWSDQQQAFFISFEEPKRRSVALTDADFQLERVDAPGSQWTRVLRRVGQTAFRFATLSRYGSECVFCTVSHDSVIEAMHLKGHANSGPMHETNGLPGCKNHHALFDAGYIAINPRTFAFESRSPNDTLEGLGASKQSLHGLKALPAQTFLEWAYKHKAISKRTKVPTPGY